MPSRRANFNVHRVALFLALLFPLAPLRAQEVELSASPSGLVGNSAVLGSPLLVTVRLDLPTGAERSVKLSGTPTDWRQAVVVELIREKDGFVVSPAQPVGPAPEGVVEVDPEAGLEGRWLFPAELLKSAGAGEYQVKTRLRLGSSAERESTWSLALIAPQPGGDQDVQRVIASAAEAANSGDGAHALKLLNDALRADPDRYELLIARGQLALSEGDGRAASFCLRRASALAARGGGEPPLSLHVLAEGLRTLSTQPAAGEPKTSGPIDLPAAVMEPLAPLAGSPVRRTKGTPLILPVEPRDAPSNAAPRANASSLSTKSSPATAASSVATTTKAGAPMQAPGTAASATSGPANHTQAVAGGSPPVSENSKFVPARAGALTSTSSAAANAPAPQVTSANSQSPAVPVSPGPGKWIPAEQLVDAKIIADRRGQWASAATASGSYGKVEYGPQQATGAPDITVAGNSPKSWCVGRQTRGEEWLELSFATPMKATGLRVRQNNAPGAICRIDAIDETGAVHLWWSGRDPLPPAAVRQITWFGIDVSPTEYRVARVRITLALDTVPGWKEIDAVQLVTAPE